MTEKILDRVRKLLALSGSSNPHEAAVAAGAAQKLMEQHGIEAAMLDTEEEPIKAHDGFDEGRRVATWRSALATGVATANGCKAVIHRSRDGARTMFIGRASDASVVRYMYAYVASEINRLCDEHAKQHRRAGRSWKNTFRITATEAVVARIHEAKKAARVDAVNRDGERASMAIQRLDQRLANADAWLAEKYTVRSRRKATYRADQDAIEAGRKAARSIRLDSNGGLSASTSGGALSSGGT